MKTAENNEHNRITLKAFVKYIIVLNVVYLNSGNVIKLWKSR